MVALVPGLGMIETANILPVTAAAKRLKLQKELKRLSADAVRLREQFVRSELDISFTLAEFADTTKGGSYLRDSARTSALQGYRTARKYAAQLPPGAARQQLEKDLNQLHAALESQTAPENGGVAPATPVQRQAEEQGVESLTRRELEVLKCIVDGHSTKQVAQRLGIAFKTAACHRQHLMAKLGVHDTATLVRCAIRRGIARV